MPKTTIPLDNTPASFPDVVALARRYHPLNVWNERVSPRLPPKVDKNKAYPLFLQAYGEALDRRRLKRGASEIQLSDQEGISLSPIFTSNEEPGLRATYKGQRVETFLRMGKEDRDSYLWAWWAWNQLPEDQRHPNTVQFLKRLEGAKGETIEALLRFIVNPALSLSGDWSADLDRVHAALHKVWGDNGSTLNTLCLLLQSFHPEGKCTRPLRFMSTVSQRAEKSDFQTPQAVVGEWADTKLDPPQRDAALEGHGLTSGLPQWWWGLIRPRIQPLGDPAKWTISLENDLEHIRKIKKLRRGTKAFNDFLIKALPGVAENLAESIHRDNTQIIEDNQWNMKQWLEKRAEARRNIEKLLNEAKANEAARRAFASFYGVSLPKVQSEGSEDYTILLSTLDALQREVVQTEPSGDDLKWDMTRKALQGVPEIMALWSRVDWRNENLTR